MEPLLLNVNEVALLLGTTAATIRWHVHRENEYAIPPSVKIGGRRMWKRKDVEEWVDKLKYSL